MQNIKQVQIVIGVDLGDKKHAICVLGNDGVILKEYSILNHKEPLQQLAKDYPGARVAMETGTHSPWISRLLAAGGMEVIVANSRKLRAIYQNERKCDELDARMLAKIARIDHDLLHPVSHISEASHQDLLAIKLRDSLVRQRVALINSVRGTLKSLGILLKNPSTPAFAKMTRTALAEESKDILAILDPILAVLDELTLRIRVMDKTIAQTAAQYPSVAKLQGIPGVGPITSLCYVLTIEDPARFTDPRDVAAYLGLVPRRDQSGSRDKQMPISKTGNVYLRGLLVQSAQYILGPFGPESDLREHGLKLAARGGKAAKKKAVVAVARKLAVILLVLWKKGSCYEAKRPKAAPVPAALPIAA